LRGKPHGGRNYTRAARARQAEPRIGSVLIWMKSKCRYLFVILALIVQAMVFVTSPKAMWTWFLFIGSHSIT
jgi:hypothetical protein